jgi:tetratricopeptide (TPR) repeat protein
LSNQQEILSGKLAFIYDSNKSSPLFVHAAAEELEKKNIPAAVEILENGIKNYPYFPAAYIMLARTYALSGDYNLSLDSLKTGTDLMQSKKTYDFYLKEIEGIRRHQNLYGSKETPEMQQEIPRTGNKPETGESMTEIEDRLEELAREISSSKIAPGNDVKPETERDENLSGGNIIVSETLAKIYISQGEIEEAKKVYLKLIQKHPDREDYYRKKINELPSGLEG